MRGSCHILQQFLRLKAPLQYAGWLVTARNGIAASMPPFDA